MSTNFGHRLAEVDLVNVKKMTTMLLQEELVKKVFNGFVKLTKKNCSLIFFSEELCKKVNKI